MTLAVEGRSSREIAQELCRSPRTIENHIRSVYQKLNVRNRVELVRAVAERGLLGASNPVSPATDREALKVKGRTLDLIHELDNRLARADHSRYFAELSIALTEVLGVRWAGLTESSSEKEGYLDLICMAERGVLSTQSECAQAGAPCGAVLAGEPIAIGDGVMDRFPAWQLGREFGVRGYISVRLDDHLGRALGTIYAVHDGPIDTPDEYLMILRLFGRRTAVELALAQMADRAGEPLELDDSVAIGGFQSGQ